MTSTRKFIRKTSQTNQTVKIPKPLSHLIDLYERNILHLILWAILIFGGIIITFHFLYIRRYPEFNFTSSLSLLIIIAITGLTITIYLVMALTGPLATWIVFFDIFSKLRDTLRKYSVETGLLFSLPILFSLLSLIILGAIIIRNQATESSTLLLVLSWLLLPLLFGSITYYVLTHFFSYPKFNWKQTTGYFVLLLLSYTLYIFTPATIFMFHYSRYSTEYIKEEGILQSLTVIIFASIFCLYFNATIFEHTIRKNLGSGQWLPKQLGFGLVMLILVLIATQSWFSIPQAVLRMYGLADIENARIIFDEKNCSSIKNLGIKYTSEENTAGCRINHATTISDIGKDRLIDSEEKIRFSVPKDGSTISEIPENIKLNAKLNQFVDKRGKLNRVNIEIQKNRNTTERLAIYLTLTGRDGKILRRELLGQNVSLGPNSDTFTKDYIVPTDLPNETDLWCDLEVKSNNEFVNTYVTKLNTFEENSD